MSDNVVALITARGGSKTIPGKNLIDLGGKPLIQWTFDAAQASDRLSRIILSTDDTKIADYGKSAGIEVPFIRPSALAGDSTSHFSVIEHALDWLQEDMGKMPDYLVLLQPTSPLRTAADIDGAVSQALTSQADAVVSMCEADNHPWLTFKISEGGCVEEYLPADVVYKQRQSLPEAYALNGAIYVNKPASLLSHKTFTPPQTQAYVMPPERSLDIDTPWDLHLVKMLVEQPYHAK